MRDIVIKREANAGIGISLKGGSEHQLPVLISKIIAGQSAHATGRLMVGDAIIKVKLLICFQLQSVEPHLSGPHLFGLFIFRDECLATHYNICIGNDSLIRI